MKITIAGDFTTEERGLKAVHEGTALSSAIRQHFIDTDISILNLETPVADSTCRPIEKNGPCLRTEKETLAYLKSCGVDVVTLANNHFYDYGDEGVEQTIRGIEEVGLQYVGGGRNAEEVKKTLYMTVGDERIAIINYCEGEFSIQDGIGSNHIDEISAFHDINEAKKNADVIIVVTHGGHEYYQLPSPRMKRLYRYFVDLGAHAVVNHHQHCYSGFEEYNGSYIFYGLGNFFFDLKSMSGTWNEGFYVEFDIHDHHISEFRIHPYKQCLAEKATVVPMSDEAEKDFEAHLEELNGIIGDDGKLQAAFHDFCESKACGYSVVFSPYSNRYMKALCKRNFLPSFFSKQRKLKALNNIQCESHQDIMLYALKNK